MTCGTDEVLQISITVKVDAWLSRRNTCPGITDLSSYIYTPSLTAAIAAIPAPNQKSVGDLMGFSFSADLFNSYIKKPTMSDYGGDDDDLGGGYRFPCRLLGTC